MTRITVAATIKVREEPITMDPGDTLELEAMPVDPNGAIVPHLLILQRDGYTPVTLDPDTTWVIREAEAE